MDLYTESLLTSHPGEHSRYAPVLVGWRAASPAGGSRKGHRVLQVCGEGSKAIRELYEKVVSTFDTDLMLTSHFLEASGSLACDSGEYEETLTNRATGQEEHYRGQYVMVFRLGRDGEWRIIQHVWSVVPVTPN